MSREAFESWLNRCPLTLFGSEFQVAELAWKACEANMQAEIDRLHALIKAKDEALKACDQAMDYISEYDIPITLPQNVKQALALTPENVRMVEVGEVGSIAICKGTPRQVTYLRKNTRTGTKLYTLVKDGE